MEIKRKWPQDSHKSGKEKWSMRTSACSGGLHCVCVCLSRRQYTCTDWVGWLSGLEWSSVDPPPGQLSVRPCQGQHPAGGWVGGRSGGGHGDASTWPPGTQCVLATAQLLHRCTLLEWTLTPIKRHNKIPRGTHSRNGVTVAVEKVQLKRVNR